METNINYTIVGTFVVLIFTFFVLAVIWLSSGFSFQLYSNYLVYMTESVSGLSVDSPVEFNGVDAGTVKSITLNPKDPQMVELLLNIKSNIPVTMGTVATLNSRGVTGVAFIALKDKSDDLRPLVATGDQPYPVIQSGPSLFTRLDTALTRLSNNLSQVSSSIQSVLNKDNLLAIQQTLQNLQRITGNLAENSNKLNILIQNTSNASQKFTPIMQSSMASMRILETQTLPKSYELLSNLNEMARNMSQVAAELKQNPSMLIRGTQPTALGPGETK